MIIFKTCDFISGGIKILKEINSCLIEGCTDPQADNYHPIFNADDGSCLYGGTGGGGGGPNDCPSDLNGDDLIGVADLLILLGEFGVPCL